MPTLQSPYQGMSPQEFLRKNPQFRNAGNELVGAALAKAAELISAAAYGTFYEQAVEYKAADLLASGQFGQIIAEPLAKAMRNTYKELFEEITLKIPRRMLTL
jgi:hypothetical protein